MKPLLLALLLATASLSAAPASDDVEVHALAHFGAGTLVAEATALICHDIPKRNPWWCSLAEVVTAYAATDAYEQLTHKTPTTRLQHDLAGALGGVGVALSVNF